MISRIYAPFYREGRRVKHATEKFICEGGKNLV